MQALRALLFERLGKFSLQAPLRSTPTINRASLAPPDPKISIFRPPPIRIFTSVMVSLGVGKRQTGEVSFKSARVSRGGS